MAKWIALQPGIRCRLRPGKRGQDRYFVIRYMRDGKQVEEGVGWSSDGYSEAEAAHIMAVIRRNIREGRAPQSLEEMRAEEEQRRSSERAEAMEALSGPVTFRQAARRFLDWSKEEHASWKTDFYRIAAHLIPLLGDAPIADLTRADALALHKTLSQRKASRKNTVLSPESVRHCMIAVSRVLERARDELTATGSPMFTGANPFHGLRRPKPDNKRWRIATDQEVELILDYCAARGGDLAAHYRLAVLLGLRCGTRLGEAMGVMGQHIHQGHLSIRLVDTKNMDSRTIYPPRDVFAEILALKARFPQNPWLMAADDAAGRIHKDTVSHFFAAATDALGLNEGITDRRGRLVFHSLRHTYGTRQIMAGMNPMVLKRLMGHRSLSTTERYVHIAEEFLAAQRARGEIT